MRDAGFSEKSMRECGTKDPLPDPALPEDTILTVVEHHLSHFTLNFCAIPFIVL